jgi:hypothetical protein
MKRPVIAGIALSLAVSGVALANQPASAASSSPIAGRGVTEFRAASPDGAETIDPAELSKKVGRSPAKTLKTRLLHDGAPVPQPVPTPGAPTVRGLGVEDAPPWVGGWDSLSQPDSRLANGGNQLSNEPSDATLCAGNGYVIGTINTLLAVYSGDGAELARADLNTFFGLPPAFNRATQQLGPNTGDPKCYFDPESQRWFFTSFAFDDGDVGYDGVAGSATGRFFIGIAVSTTSDPTGEWYQWVLDGTNDGQNGTVSHENCPCIPDQPLIGADRYGFYVSTNEFGPWPAVPETTFNGAQIYAFDKQAMITGSPTPNIQLIENIPLAEDKGYSIQPQTSSLPWDYDTKNEGTAYFLSALDFFGTGDSRIAAWRMTNTASLRTSPDVQLAVEVLDSQAYASPSPMEQAPGPTPLRDLLADPANPLGLEGAPFDNAINQLNSNDDRMQQAVLTRGRLYGAVHSQMVVDGESRTGIAWFGVKVRNGRKWARLDRQGYIAASGNNLSFPAIAAGPSGRPVAVMSLVGPDQFPSVVYTTLGNEHWPLQLVASGAGPADGFSGYAPFGEGVERWGDYHGAAFMNGRIYAITNYVSARPRTTLVNTGTFISAIPAW